MRVSVHHWNYSDGKPDENAFGHPGVNIPKGWHGWAYTNSDSEFKQWMNDNCPTADCIHRFNSGNPMYTIWIKDEKEANIFTLRWIHG